MRVTKSRNTVVAVGYTARGEGSTGRGAVVGI